ncbi:methyltransferase domain-containing protein [Streptomyces mayteni]
MATGASVPVHRVKDPEAWQRAAEADVPLVTQWDDGDHAGSEPGTVPTSSASMPSVVAGMLDDLDVAPGHRVLEIGTGTGWNAALLAHRLGEENVTTVEIDGTVAEAAERALSRAGLRPRVLTGDGALGAPGSGLFDRVIATCGVREIPQEWLRQVRPGGLVLIPWGTHYSNADALLRLTVGDDGSASGPFLRPVEFMKLRAQRFTWPTYPADGSLPVSEFTVAEAPPAHVAWHPFAFAAGLRMPGAAHAVQPLDDGHVLWLYSLRDQSWSSAERRTAAGAVTRVRQVGHRGLWDELSAAHRWWTSAGRPGVDRLGLTVLGGGEVRGWLDTPSNSWHLGGEAGATEG